MHALAENPRARIGGNSGTFGEDEERPPKALRIVDRDRLAKIAVAVTMSAKRCAIAKKYVMEKRKGGEDGRLLRGFNIYYAGGIGSPAWEREIVFDLNRKQIGQEEQAFMEMCVRNPVFEQMAERLTAMCDAAIGFDPKEFIRHGLMERAADAARRKAVKTVREAADLLARPTPKPVKRPKLSEAERVQAAANARHRAEKLAEGERILRRIVEVGEAPSATKEQRSDARKARLALEEIGASKA